MKAATRKKMEAAGWKTGSVSDFLGLTKEDEAFIDLKVALAKALQRERERQHMTQAQVAKLVSSSQPRVAFMEAGKPSVSIDLLIRTLLAMGHSLSDVARVIRTAAKHSAA